MQAARCWPNWDQLDSLAIRQIDKFEESASSGVLPREEFAQHKETDMATKRRNIESQEVRKRAAEIRRHWSPLERAQRTGLPPDIPARLRAFLLGPVQPQLSVVAARSLKVCNPFRPC
jgi:hypothetical protein